MRGLKKSQKPSKRERREAGINGGGEGWKMTNNLIEGCMDKHFKTC